MTDRTLVDAIDVGGADLTKAATYTDEENTGLQNLFTGLGYSQRPMENNFVELSKELP